MCIRSDLVKPVGDAMAGVNRAGSGGGITAALRAVGGTEVRHSRGDSGCFDMETVTSKR